MFESGDYPLLKLVGSFDEILPEFQVPDGLLIWEVKHHSGMDFVIAKTEDEVIEMCNYKYGKEPIHIRQAEAIELNWWKFMGAEEISLPEE